MCMRAILEITVRCGENCTTSHIDVYVYYNYNEIKEIYLVERGVGDGGWVKVVLQANNFFQILGRPLRFQRILLIRGEPKQG